MGEEAPDMLLSPTKAEIKPLCPVSIDSVADDTPEKIEPKSVKLRSVEVRARYLDTSSSSCHDYCKYGHKNQNESITSFIAKQKKKMVVNSSPNSPIKRASSLSTPGANCNTKYNDIILRNGVGVIQLSPMRGLLSKGKKKEFVQPNTPLSPKPPIKRALSGNSQNAKDLKGVSRLKRHSNVEKGDTKKLFNENNSTDKKVGKALCFESEKGKQKSPVAVTTRSSFVFQNVLSKTKKKLDETSISKKKVEHNSRPKVLVKKIAVEDKNDSAHKLGFKRGKVIDVKTDSTPPRRLKFKVRKVVAEDLNGKADDVAGLKTELANTPPRKLKFKPRKVVAEDLNGKADDVAGSKTELANTPSRKLKFKPRKVVAKDLNGKADDVAGSKTELAKKMTSVVKVGINIRRKKEISSHKLDFQRGKVIDVQSKSNAARRLKFKPRKLIVDNINGENSRRILKKVVGSNEAKELNTEHLKIVLKHQNIEGKKDVQSLLNNVIEETATRLVRLRKSKVKALVGAFESLMTLPDAKSSTTSAS